MHLPAAEVVRDVVTYRGAISIRGIHPSSSSSSSSSTATSDMQRRRRALIDDRQPRLTPRATLARLAAGIT